MPNYFYFFPFFLLGYEISKSHGCRKILSKTKTPHDVNKEKYPKKKLFFFHFLFHKHIMELHNIDEYLDLQDQNEINLLSAESIPPVQPESEWHSVTSTPADSILTTNDNNLLYGTENNNSSSHSNNRNSSNWGFGLDFNLLSNSSNNDVINFITPDSLLKQPEQRVTRSRSTGSVPIVTTTYKKKKTSRPKKLYCICQQPYNGKPMVQCDNCEEWYVVRIIFFIIS